MFHAVLKNDIYVALLNLKYYIDIHLLMFFVKERQSRNKYYNLSS